MISPIGFGAFKIGRNQGIKYAQGYDLPDEAQVKSLFDGVLDLGINYIDTAAAYGLSEERIGRAIGPRRGNVIISTKVGEEFEHGRSRHDYSIAAVSASVSRSRRRLGRDVLDLVFVHSDGRDLALQLDSEVVTSLRRLRADGIVRAIGLSAKTVEGARAALEWADAIMVELHPGHDAMAPVIREAHDQGVGVVVKKGLGSGRIPAADAIAFVLGHAGVSSMVIGSLSLDHMRRNVEIAESLR